MLSCESSQTWPNLNDLEIAKVNVNPISRKIILSSGLRYLCSFVKEISFLQSMQLEIERKKGHKMENPRKIVDNRNRCIGIQVQFLHSWNAYADTECFSDTV